MRTWIPGLVALLAVPLSCLPALSSPCGDDIAGKRVACRCGDTVVTSTRLLADDPVVVQRCPIDGLVVRADKYAESITIDFDGTQIRGSQAGIGLRVEYGGTDGAQVIGAREGERGGLVGFGIGLSANRTNALAKVIRLDLRGNRDEGARVTIAGAVFVDVVASGNGRDGFSVRGSGGRFADVSATANGENGFRLFADHAAVGVVASDNVRTGIIIDGTDNDLEAAEAVGNGRDGIVARGTGGDWEVLRSEDNTRDDLRANGHAPEAAEEMR
jgi:hypothetical protein